MITLHQLSLLLPMNFCCIMATEPGAGADGLEGPSCHVLCTPDWPKPKEGPPTVPQGGALQRDSVGCALSSRDLESRQHHLGRGGQEIPPPARAQPSPPTAPTRSQAGITAGKHAAAP